MKIIHYFFDYVLHLHAHLDALVQNYGPWVYVILFLIVFCETGLIVTPFLPGDSLLFAVGALCGVGTMDLGVSLAVLLAAAILGDTVNYWAGYWTGPKVFRQTSSRWFNPRHLERAHAFSERYGPKAIVLARFVPIVRTFVPFVVGIGRLTYVRFMAWNVAGGILWVGGLVTAGYWFGNVPIVKERFSLVVLAIIGLSLLPVFVEVARQWRGREKSVTP